MLSLIVDCSCGDLPAGDSLAVVRSFAVAAVGRSHYHRHHHSNLEQTCLTVFVLGLIGIAPSR